MYTAAILDESSVKTLRALSEKAFDLTGFQFLTAQGQTLPHHMTVNLGPLDPGLNPGIELDETTGLVVSRLGRNDRIGVCAAQIETSLCGSKRLRSANRFPHVTLCIMPWAKPKDANKIFSEDDTIWVDLECKLVAVLRESCSPRG
jgi:hypothetical protein